MNDDGTPVSAKTAQRQIVGLRYRLAGAGDQEFAYITSHEQEFTVVREGKTLACSLLTKGPPARYWVRDDSTSETLMGRVITVHSNQLGLHVEGCDIDWVRAQSMRGIASTATESGAGDVRAPMPGRIVRMAVNVGDEVNKGTPLLAIEAMKMENELFSPTSGTVSAAHVKAGDIVDTGQILVLIRAPAEASETGDIGPTDA